MLVHISCFISDIWNTVAAVFNIIFIFVLLKLWFLEGLTQSCSHGNGNHWVVLAEAT